jgi:hypothetical protein
VKNIKIILEGKATSRHQRNIIKAHAGCHLSLFVYSMVPMENLKGTKKTYVSDQMRE